MIRCIIVDDEPNAISSLETQLRKVGNIDVVATCENIDQAKQAIASHKPELLFLDVELSDHTGFELLESLAQHQFDVIFSTAYEQYALQAIKASALDYLMKPVLLEELVLAINKYLSKKDDRIVNKQVEVLFEHYKNNNSIKTLALPASDGIEFINVDDIIRLESESNYTNFFLINNRKIVIAHTLKEYEKILAGNGFYRIHNSHIINLQYLDKYFRGDGGYVRMKDGSIADVSRHRKEEFMKLVSK